MKFKCTAATLLLILTMAISLAPIPIAAGGNSIDTFSGSVNAAMPQDKYTLRPIAGQSARLSVAARSTRHIQIQVTDENNKPVADLLIVFKLSDSCLGTIGEGVGAGTTARARTDNRGIATVLWVVGAAKCAANIAATVEGTKIAFTYQVAVQPPPGWEFKVEEGKTTRSNISLNNGCSEPHRFRIKSKIKYLRFEQPTDAILIGAKSTELIGVVFDATGLESKVYRDKLVVECRDCKKERGCRQGRSELAFEMSVFKR